MSVITHAQTTTTGGYQPRDADYLALNPAQQALVTTTLRDLGIDNTGYNTGDTGIPAPAYRAAISTTAAQQIGMHLPAGHEIALCADCLTISDAHLMRQCADDAWRCDDDTDPFGNSCAQRYARQYEQD